MAQVLNQFNNQVQNLPLYNQISGLYENQIGERFSTKDPFYEKVPAKDKRELKPGEKMEYKEIRRKPPTNISEKQRKLWKKVMKRAWYHDRNFCGCMPIDLGCGMISIVSIFPIIGSAIAYNMHYKMIKMCNEAGCPKKIQAEMVANIGLDFAMTLVPLLGVVLSWMKASSTRNAALFDTWMRQQSMEKDELVQRQNHQQSRLQGPSQGQGGAPAQPEPSAAHAPPTESQQQTHTRTPRSTGPRDAAEVAGSTQAGAAGQRRPPQGYAAPNARGAPAQHRAVAQRRPVPSSGQGPSAQNHPAKTQPRPAAPTSVPRNAPPVSSSSAGSPPPYANSSVPGQRPSRVPVRSSGATPQAPLHSVPAPHAPATTQARPPVPPKIPASAPGPRRIPPAGSYDFGSRQLDSQMPDAAHGAAYDVPPLSSHKTPYDSPNDSPYDSPYGSPYGSPYRASSEMPPASSAAATAALASYGQQPDKFHSSPVASPHSYPRNAFLSYDAQPYGGPSRTAHKSQKYFMQPAIRTQPEVVEL